MDKKSIVTIIIFACLLFLWQRFGKTIVAPFFPEQPVVEQAADPTGSDAASLVANETNIVEEVADVVVEPVVEEVLPLVASQAFYLKNSNVVVQISSNGGGVAEATMLNYEEQKGTDVPVKLKFSDHALVYDNLIGLGALDAFTVEEIVPGRELLLTRKTEAGLELQRSVKLAENSYELEVVDTLTNRGAAAVEYKEPKMQMGRMADLNEQLMRGMISLGFDSLSQAEGKVYHWGKKPISKMFKSPDPNGVTPLERSLEMGTMGPSSWVALKNMYFVQIFEPEFAVWDATITAYREKDETEIMNPAKVNKTIDALSATVKLQPFTLAPSESYVQKFSCYMGPKDYKELKLLGTKQSNTMEFGVFGIIGKPLLILLNFIYKGVGNYGLAIILMTIMVRLVFWPITNKGTQSMKRMQELQPKMKELKEKYKDPQRVQQETMKLYKEHKVNPLGGCFPMLIQIPVFIALFKVLRSAIELRYAGFLWVADLSQPENLLPGMIFGFSLNILPLLMAGTMFLQQKMTPSAGDPQQQKMMQFMPVMMLFLFYNMASGLVLYWTTSQALQIFQQYVTNHSKKKDPATAKA